MMRTQGISKKVRRTVDFGSMMGDPGMVALMNDALNRPVNSMAKDTEEIRMNSDVPARLCTILFNVYERYRTLGGMPRKSVWPTQHIVRRADDGKTLLVDTGIPLGLSRTHSPESVNFGRWYFLKPMVKSDGPRTGSAFAGWVDKDEDWMDAMRMICHPNLVDQFTNWPTLQGQKTIKYGDAFKEDIWTAAQAITNGTINYSQLTMLAMQCQEKLAAAESEEGVAPPPTQPEKVVRDVSPVQLEF
jgi:hypothetical protein